MNVVKPEFCTKTKKVCNFLNQRPKAANCTNFYNVCNFEKHTTVSMYNGRYAHTYT